MKNAIEFFLILHPSYFILIPAEGERLELPRPLWATPVFGTGALPVMRTLREAGAGGVEPPSTVLETAVLPVTPCSPGSIDFSLCGLRLRKCGPAQTKVYATQMLSEGIEPPMTARAA